MIYDTALPSLLDRWYQQGIDVQSKLPHLATYLGHVSPVSTHHYLHFSPDLRQAASRRFHRHAVQFLNPGGDHESTT